MNRLKKNLKFPLNFEQLTHSSSVANLGPTLFISTSIEAWLVLEKVPNIYWWCTPPSELNPGQCLDDLMLFFASSRMDNGVMKKINDFNRWGKNAKWPWDSEKIKERERERERERDLEKIKERERERERKRYVE